MPETQTLIAVTGAQLLARARSYIGRYTDADARKLALEVGVRFPRQASYAALAQPGTHWCGIFVAKLLAEFGIEGPFGATDITRWMWVDAWKSFGVAVPVALRQPGDICLWLGDPHHIAIYAGDNKYVGGNQSDAVTETVFRTPDVVRRLPTATPVELIERDDPALLPLLTVSDVGPYVAKLQRLLGGIAVDGEFGEETEAAVRAFQAKHSHLEVDGEVGPQTWAVLLGKPVPVSDEPKKFVEYKAGYAADWKRMVIDADKAAAVDQLARRSLANKARYQAASAKTGVPWFVIAAWHDRESGGDFDTQLAQGDPLDQVSTHVPAGRGPFPTWDAGAYDALVTLKALNTVSDWTIERIAYESERYNGFGYRSQGVPSAYLWSFSNVYRGGKYVADGVFDFGARDKQCGVLPLIKRIAELDSSIVIRSYTDAPPIDPPDKPIEEPPIDGEVLEPAQPDLQQMLLIVLLVLAQERFKMPDTPGAPQVDLQKVLAALLQSLGGQLKLPPPEPPPPPPPPQPTDTSALLKALLEALTQKPAAEPVKTEPVADPAKPATPATTVDFRAGLVGVIGSALAWWTGMAGEGTAIATGAGSVIASALGIPAPLWAIGRGLLSRITLRPK